MKMCDVPITPHAYLPGAQQISLSSSLSLFQGRGFLREAIVIIVSERTGIDPELVM